MHSSRQSNAGESYEEGDSDGENDSILPDNPLNNSDGFKNMGTSSGNNSLLGLCPDVTIIKKEKPEAMVNNNSNHSESSSDQGK